MKIEKFYNKKEQRNQFKARFQMNNREFYLTADTKSKLLELIDNVRVQERQRKYGLPSAIIYPTLESLFIEHSKRVPKKNHRTLFNRVSKVFLSLLPEGIRVNELKKAHWQKYIDLRLSQFSKCSKQSILPETIDKELYAISAALRDAPLYFTELENYVKPNIPRASKGVKKRKRDRVVSRNELNILLTELRKERTGKQTFETEKHRHRLADDLEFRIETGLRRKEVARLKKNQYFAEESCLRKVIRWKTDSVTKYFPLSIRAKEIIENRLKNNQDSEYIFTLNGEPQESDYRTLRVISKQLGLVYGKFAENGFIAHDLRHSFATEIIEHADIETTRELLGHSKTEQTANYLHTNEKRMSEAIRKREGISLNTELIDIYKQVRRRKLKAKDYLKRIKKILSFC